MTVILSSVIFFYINHIVFLYSTAFAYLQASFWLW